MKTRMRVLSIIICLALLMSAAPVDLRLSAGYASEAEPEVAPVEEAAAEAADAEASEVPPAEAPPEDSAEPDAIEAPEPEAVEASEPDEAGAEAPDEAAEAAGEAEPAADAGAEPFAEAVVEPGAQGDEIDYSAAASASPAFAEGCAEVIRDDVAVYVDAAPDAQVRARLNRGVVYAVGRSDAEPDRVEILFNAGPERGVDRGWVDADALRPMEPTQEVPAFAAFCEDLEEALYPDELAGLPLARISCTYPEADGEREEEQTEVRIEEQVTEEASEPEAEPEEQEHPVIDWSQLDPEPDGFVVPEEEVPEAEAEQGELSMDAATFAAQPSIVLRAGTLNLGVGESFDLQGTGFVSCTADEGAKIKLGFTVAAGNCISVSDSGVLFAARSGNATVTITELNTGENASLNVVVKSNASSVTMRDSLTLGVGMTADLKITYPEGSYSSFQLSCDPEGVVELDQSGRVTAANPGATTVTLKTNNGLTDTCFITVVDEPVNIETDSEITIALNEQGRSVRAKVYIGGTEVPCDFHFEVTDGQECVRVDATSGALTALSLGIATVTVSAAGTQPANCVVYVATSPDSVTLRAGTLKMGAGETYQISDGENGIIAVSPGSHISSYSYRSSDASIVSVSASGLLTAKAPGTATISINPSSMNDPLELAVTVVKAASSIKLNASEITLKPGESREIQVSFPSGGYSTYDLYLPSSGEKDEEGEEGEDAEPSLTIARSSGDHWTIKAADVLYEGEIRTLIARAASGAAASCIVKLMPGPGSEEDIEIALTKQVLGIGEPGGKITASIADGVIAESGFTYTSSNPNVLSVDGAGNLTAHSVSGGDGVTITATATVPGAEGRASRESDPIVVVSYPTRFEFKPGKETLRLGVGDSYPLRLGEEDGDPDGIMDISPSDARTVYTYSVASGGSYGSVSSDGVITAKKAGTMKVRITPASGPNPTPKTLTVSISKAASSIALDRSSLRVGTGMAVEPLRVSFPDGGYARYEASSSDESVLEVRQNGDTVELVPVSGGQATVIVRSVGKNCVDSCLVEVVDTRGSLQMDAPTSIGVNEAGRKVTAAFQGEPLSARISFQSNNASVLEVDASTGALSARSEGVATVSAYLNYRGDGTDEEVASRRITVVPAPKSISLDPTLLKLRVDEIYTISDDEGCMIMLDAGSHASYTFASSEPKIASVSAAGEVKGLAPGVATITITAQNGTEARLTVQVVKDFTLKAAATQLGVGMKTSLSVANEPDDAFATYTCAPQDALEITEGGNVKALKAGTAIIYAQAGTGANEKLSNAVVLKVLPAPTEEQILFSSESADRVSLNQTGAMVTASCAPGTMAELGYRLGEGAPQGVSINPTTGALTIGSSGSGTSFTVEAYDKNNGTSAAHSVTILGRSELSGLKQSTLQLSVGETYQLSDGPDGIIQLNAVNASGSYKFKSSKTSVATVSAFGLITAKKAGSAKITITSANDKSNKAVLTLKVVKDGGASLNPGVLTLGLGMTGGKLTPSSATLRLTSSNEDVVTVDAFGNIKTIGIGEATVSAVHPTSGKSDTALVRVVPRPVGVEFDLDEIVMGKSEKNMKAVAHIIPADSAEAVGTIAYEMEDKSEEKYVKVNASTGALTARKATPADEPVSVRAYVKEYPSLSETLSVTVVSKTSVSLTTKSIQLGKGNTYQLREFIPEDEEEEYALDYEDEEDEEELPGIIRISPAEASANTTYSYKTSNAKIATVSASGLIRAVGTGKAKITIATQSNRSASLTVQVYKLPDSISLSTSNLELGAGMKHTLKASFLPAKTYDSFRFSSSDSEVAEVDPLSGAVTAVSEGEAIITARTENGLTANCRVAVLPATEEIHLSIERSGRTIELSDGDSLTLGMGEKKLKLSAAPDENTVGQFKFMLANSSDKKKLTVNATTGALNILKATGDEPVDVVAYDVNNEDITATISVEIRKKPTSKSQLTLSPSSIRMALGESFQITERGDEYADGLIALADGYAASYTFKSNNTKIVTVSASGLIRAIGTGSTKVRIATQNSSVYKDLTVTVSDAPTAMQISPAIRLGSGMTEKLIPTFTPSGAFGSMEVEVVGGDGKLEASVDPATCAISLTAGTVTTRTSATVIARIAGTSISDSCSVTLLPAPKVGEVEFDYENIPAATWENGSWVIRVGKSEKGVFLAAKCSDSNAMSGFTFGVNGSPSGLKVNATSGELTAATIDSYIVTATSISNPAAQATARVEVVAGPNAVYFHTSDNPKATSYTLQMGVGEQYRIAEYRKNIQTGEESGIIAIEPEQSSASYTFAASKSSSSLSATSVLSVDKNTGLITARQVGTAYVRISTQNSKYRVMTVNVVNAPEAVEVVPDPAEVGENGSGKITLKFTPADSSSQAISYISSDPALVEMGADGFFVTHDLRETGTPESATITVTTRNGIVASGKVTVLPHPTEVHFAKPVYEVGEGMKLATAPGPFPGGQNAQRFRYESRDPEIATIDAMTGVITGVAEGTATISITANPGKSYAVSGEATVNVVPAPASASYEGLGLPEVLRIAKDDVVTIPEPQAYSASGKPIPANYSFSLKTASDWSYLTIEGNQMTGIKSGKDVIVVATTHNGKTAEIRVRVYDEAPGDAEIYFEGRKVNNATISMYVNQSHPTDTIALSGRVNGVNINYGAVEFSSSNPALASVDAHGTVTVVCNSDGKAPSGTATIYATTRNGNANAQCYIRVGELCESPVLRTPTFAMQEGEKEKIDIVCNPSTSGMRMSFTSSNPQAVTVDMDGAITAVGGGEAKIAITGQYGWSSEVSVSVLYNPDDITLPVRKLYMEPGESVVLTPNLSRSGIASAKVNLFTDARSSYPGVVTVAKALDASQQDGLAASYTVTAVADGSQSVTFTSYNGLTAVCNIVVKRGGWAEDPSGFGWDEDAELYLIKGDTTELEYGLTASAYSAGGGYSVEVAPESAGLMEMQEDGSVKALATGTATLQLRVDGQVTNSVQIQVIDPVAPKLWYGPELNDPVRSKLQLDIGIEGVDSGNHVIRIEKLPAPTFSEYSILLGTYEVTIADETLLEFDRTTNQIRTREVGGTTTVTVKTYGNAVQVEVSVVEPTVYRALLISEYNGRGGSSKLPFAQMNVTNMQAALRRSDIGGKTYDIQTLNDPTESEIQLGMQSFFEGTKDNDISLIYVVSHGHMGSGSAKDQYSFSLGKFDKGDGSTYVTDTELMTWIQSYVKGRVVLVLDSCNSGGFISHQKGKGLYETGNIAVITAQVKNQSASFYVGPYKNVNTYEFFTRAFHIALGYQTNAGTGDDWNAAIDADDDEDGYITIDEAFTHAEYTTEQMVDKYCWDTYFNADSSYGFKAPGLSSREKAVAWRKKNDGKGQVPQIYIPNAMKDLVIFGKAS